MERRETTQDQAAASEPDADINAGLPNKRSHPRFRLPGATARLNAAGTEETRAVRDISAQGLGIEGSSPAGLGESVTVELAGERLAGTIRWIKDGLFGLLLHRPLARTRLLEIALQAKGEDRVLSIDRISGARTIESSLVFTAEGSDIKIQCTVSKRAIEQVVTSAELVSQSLFRAFNGSLALWIFLVRLKVLNGELEPDGSIWIDHRDIPTPWPGMATFEKKISAALPDGDF